MMKDNCGCFHHGLVKCMLVLLWLAALGFWWASVFNQSLLWMDADHFFMEVVVLAILMFTSKFCGCCGGMVGGKLCSHDMGCKCGDCGMCK